MVKVNVKIAEITDNNIKQLEKYMKIEYISKYSNVVIGETNSINQIKQLPFVISVSTEHTYKPQVIYNNIEKPVSYITQEGTFITNYQAEQYHTPINLTGKNIRIAILDTGVNYDHPLLKGKIVENYNIAGGDIKGLKQPHGTWIAGTLVAKETEIKLGTIKGVVPDAEIVNIKVLNDDGVGTTSTIIKGLDKAIESNCKVANLSLATPISDNTLEHAIVDYAKHIVLCCAGGNFGNDSYIGCPADNPNTIAVGSIYPINNKQFKISSFSPKGVDIVAVGGELTPPYYIVSTAKDSYYGMAGTSMATPYITGFIAKLLQKHQNIPPQDIINKIHNLPKHNQYTGIGLLNEKQLYDIFTNKTNNINNTNIQTENQQNILPLLAALLLLPILL